MKESRSNLTSIHLSSTCFEGSDPKRRSYEEKEVLGSFGKAVPLMRREKERKSTTTSIRSRNREGRKH